MGDVEQHRASIAAACLASIGEMDDGLRLLKARLEVLIGSMQTAGYESAQIEGVHIAHAAVRVLLEDGREAIRDVAQALPIRGLD
jgi:hypothetical protein